MQNMHKCRKPAIVTHDNKASLCAQICEEKHNKYAEEYAEYANDTKLSTQLNALTTGKIYTILKRTHK